MKKYILSLIFKDRRDVMRHYFSNNEMTSICNALARRAHDNSTKSNHEGLMKVTCERLFKELL